MDRGGYRFDSADEARPSDAAAKRPAPPPAPEPPSNLEQLHVNGAVSSAVVRRILLSHHTAARTCVAKTTGSRSVRVTVKFFISATGRVLQARFQVTGVSGHDKAIQTCLSSALEKQRFPAPSNGAPVSVRYVFRF